MKFQYKILLLGLIFQTFLLPMNILAQPANPATAILGGTVTGDTPWIESPWFGWYWASAEQPGWVYSLDWDSYLYAVAGEGDSVFLWEHPAGTWFLARPDSYSWVWSLASDAWIDAFLLGASRDWEFHTGVVDGIQFDAAAGPDQRLHLVSKAYHQIDRYGNRILSEPYGDSSQGQLNFPPAIAVGPSGDVHTVTRATPGFTNLNLRYRKRSADGTWSADYQYGTISKRNYVVGVTVPDSAAPVLFHTTAYENVWGDIFLYEAGPAAAPELGVVPGLWRSDNDARLKSHGDKVFLVAGHNNPNGKATITWGMAGPNLIQELNDNQRIHKEGYGGENRRGFPDLAVDGNGTAHFVYGAYQTLQYNRYDNQGQKALSNDIALFRELGEYHLSAGLGAIGVSQDGSKLVAVALETDGAKEASNCNILWTHSLDGGLTWSAPEDLGVRTSGGEGRLRPKIVTIGSTFYLFYYDIQTSAISLGIRHF